MGFLLLTVWVVPGLLSSVSAHHLMRFQQLSVASGYVEPRVHTVACDTSGYLWFGTERGLSKYDGHTIKTFAPVRNADDEIRHLTVYAIQEDPWGKLWLAGGNDGLYRFDPFTQRFQPFPHDPSVASSPRPGRIRAIELGENCLWFAAEKGLSALDFDTHKSTHFLEDLVITDIYEESPNCLWLGSAKSEVLRFDPASGKREFIALRTATDSKPRRVRIEPGADQDLWIGVVGTQGGGLYCLDTLTQKVRAFRNDPMLADSLSDNSVTALKYDTYGTLWVGTRDGGLNRFQRSTGTFERFVPEPGNDYTIPHFNVRSITQDKLGFLWVGTRGGGVCRLEPREPWFTHYGYDANYSDVGFFGTVVAIDQAPDGRVCVASSRSVIEWDGKRDVFVRYLGHSTSSGKYLSSSLRTLHAGKSSNTFFIGTKDGLEKHDLEKNRFERVDSIPDEVNAIEESGTKIWLGTALGLKCIDNRTWELTGEEVWSRPGLHVAVSALCLEGDSVLWVGKRDCGLTRVDLASDNTRNFVKDADGLPSDRIRAVYVDSRSWVWAGTTQGLCRLSADRDKWILYGEEDGFTEEGVQTIGEDSDGNMWIGTASGIVRMGNVHSDHPTVHRYQELNGDGVGSIQGYCKINDGLLAFGCNDGVYLVNPSAWWDSDPPAVLVTDLKVNNTSVPISGGGSAILNRHIAAEREITLSNRDRIVTFDFAAVDFQDVNMHRYAASLEPFDSGFRDLGHENSVTYTNLPPGDYTLRARAANSRGVWSDKDAVLKIRMLPAWWQTWTFRASVLAALLGLSLLAYKLRTRRMRQNNRALSAEVEQRKTAQAALMESEQFIRLVADNLPVFIAYADKDGVFRFTNRAFRAVFDLDEAEIAGSSLEQVYGELYEEQIKGRVEAVLSGEGGTYACELTAKNGSKRHYDTQYVPHRDESGSVIGFFLLAEDITDKLDTEKELQVRRDELAHFSRVALLGEMTGALAHEINQPLAGVSFQAQAARRLLTAGEVEASVLREIVEDILTDNTRASEIVKRLWNLYKRGEITSEPFDLNDLVQDTVDLVRPQLDSKGIRLRVVVPRGPLIVHGDYIQLQQVFLNLARNGEDAIGDDLVGSVPPELKVEVSTEDEFVDIAFTDSGPGIDPDRVNAIFSPFNTSKSKGLGLGLSISKTIVDAHGGEITAVSQFGEGATFHVRLPLRSDVPCKSESYNSQRSGDTFA